MFSINISDAYFDLTKNMVWKGVYLNYCIIHYVYPLIPIVTAMLERE